jgi:predicted phosphohydrolase
MKRLNTKAKRFQYISDLHLETRKELVDIKVCAKNMILAGDIGNPFHDNYTEFLKRCSGKYQNTFLITGNHEYWNKAGINETNEKIQNITDKYDNIHFINNKVIEMNNTYILGCTLWSNLISLNSDSKIIGDDLNIYKSEKEGILGKTGFMELHKKDVHWLSGVLKQCDESNSQKLKKDKKKVIVVTHHLPTFKLLHKKYKNQRAEPYLDRFYSNLDHLVKPPIRAWIGGHSHCNMKVYMNGVFLGISAYGYPNQYEKYYSKHKMTSFIV